MERQSDQGAGYVLNGEHVQRSRLRIDARKWMAGKLRPKVYGEKQQVDHTNSDGSLSSFLTAVAGNTGRIGESDEGA